MQPLTRRPHTHQPQVHLAQSTDLMLSKGTKGLVVIKWLDQTASMLEQDLFNHEVKVLQHLLTCINQAYWLPLLNIGQDTSLPYDLCQNQTREQHQYPKQQQIKQYLVVPYIEAGSLADALTKSTYSLEEIQQLLMQLIDAIENLHQCGWLHLDLKPSNILLKNNTQVFLIDFALAQPVDSEIIQQTLNKTTHKVVQKTTQGTPKYMSPEQFLARQLNHQTDYYALGLILYQLLTGQLPFWADSYQQWAIQHCQQPMPLLPEPLASFQNLIDGLLAKDRQYRLQNTSQIRDLANNAFMNIQ